MVKTKDEYKSEFLNKSINVHGGKYIYPEFEYKSLHSNIDIVCQIHGTFSQEINTHLRGSGCPKCGYSNRRIGKSTFSSNEERKLDFIKKAIEIHENFYDYSQVDYKRSKSNVKIICPEHGEFFQWPANHLLGKECNKCSRERGRKSLSKTTEEFINDAIEIHGDRYNYSNVEYYNWSTKVIIICKKHNFEFLISPNDHTSGKQGCPRCRESIGEMCISNYLEKNNIKYIKEKTFPDCRHIGILIFDFYIEDKNLIIEFDGEQHFKSIEYFGGDHDFEIRKIRDEIKTKYCLDNNITLVRIPYYDFDNIEKILDNFFTNYHKNSSYRV